MSSGSVIFINFFCLPKYFVFFLLTCLTLIAIFGTLTVKYFTVRAFKKAPGAFLTEGAFGGLKVVSEPAKGRLLQLLRILENHVAAGEPEPVTSALAEQLSGWPRDTIRKDISGLIGDESPPIGSRAGYDPKTLIPMIKKALDLDRPRKFCVVGLGRLGSAYLNFGPRELGEFEFAAGFDTNVNRVEILKAQAPLYPAFKMREVINRFGIEIALICVPAESAQAAAEKCAAAGVKGILNFAPIPLRLPPAVAVRNIFIADDLRSLAVKMGG